MRTYLTILLIAIPVFMFGQTEHKDSVNAINLAIDSSLVELKQSHIPIVYNRTYGYFSVGRPLPIYRTPLHIDGIFYAPNLTPGEATLSSWPTGAATASGHSTIMPGLMSIDHGAIGIAQRFNNLSFYFGGTADKYGYFRGLHTQYGIEGKISYRFSTNMSITAFANYYFDNTLNMAGGMPMSPAIAGYYNAPTFGGYADCQISDRFGIEIGSQAVRQFGTHSYRPEPIVTPYINFGNGNKRVHIGLPVGQIVYGILTKNR